MSHPGGANYTALVDVHLQPPQPMDIHPILLHQSPRGGGGGAGRISEASCQKYGIFEIQIDLGSTSLGTSRCDLVLLRYALRSLGVGLDSVDTVSHDFLSVSSSAVRSLWISLYLSYPPPVKRCCDAIASLVLCLTTENHTHGCAA